MAGFGTALIAASTGPGREGAAGRSEFSWFGAASASMAVSEGALDTSNSGDCDDTVPTSWLLAPGLSRDACPSSWPWSAEATGKAVRSFGGSDIHGDGLSALGASATATGGSFRLDVGFGHREIGRPGLLGPGLRRLDRRRWPWGTIAEFGGDGIRCAFGGRGRLTLPVVGAIGVDKGNADGIQRRRRELTRLQGEEK